MCNCLCAKKVFKHKKTKTQKVALADQLRHLTYLKSEKCYSLSHVQFFATPWTVACQFPLSMEFSRQEYWSVSPLLQGICLT